MEASAIAPRPVPVLHVEFPAVPEEVSRQLTDLPDVLLRHDISGDLRDNVLLVLGEVLNNIAEHAGRGGAEGVDLELDIVCDRLHVRTQDSGLALPACLLGSPTLPEMGATVDDLPEGGFGWFIIHALVDDMVYEREAGRNVLSFSFLME